MVSEPKDSAPEPILEGQAWDRFDALGRPSPNDRYLRKRDMVSGIDGSAASDQNVVDAGPLGYDLLGDAQQLLALVAAFEQPP